MISFQVGIQHTCPDSKTLGRLSTCSTHETMAEGWRREKNRRETEQKCRGNS